MEVSPLCEPDTPEDGESARRSREEGDLDSRSGPGQAEGAPPPVEVEVEVSSVPRAEAAAERSPDAIRTRHHGTVTLKSLELPPMITVMTPVNWDGVAIPLGLEEDQVFRSSIDTGDLTEDAIWAWCRMLRMRRPSPGFSHGHVYVGKGRPPSLTSCMAVADVRDVGKR